MISINVLEAFFYFKIFVLRLRERERHEARFEHESAGGRAWPIWYTLSGKPAGHPEADLEPACSDKLVQVSGLNRTI